MQTNSKLKYKVIKTDSLTALWTTLKQRWHCGEASFSRLSMTTSITE